jgi:hypothetical protein
LPGQEPKTVGVNIFYDTGGKGIEKLLTFPIHPSMMMMQSEGEAELAIVSAENGANFDVADAPKPQSAPHRHRIAAVRRNHK